MPRTPRAITGCAAPSAARSSPAGSHQATRPALSGRPPPRPLHPVSPAAKAGFPPCPTRSRISLPTSRQPRANRSLPGGLPKRRAFPGWGRGVSFAGRSPSPRPHQPPSTRSTIPSRVNDLVINCGAALSKRTGIVANSETNWAIWLDCAHITASKTQKVPRPRPCPAPIRAESVIIEQPSLTGQRR